jgi:hypothetical protein
MASFGPKPVLSIVEGGVAELMGGYWAAIVGNLVAGEGVWVPGYSHSFSRQNSLEDWDLSVTADFL